MAEANAPRTEPLVVDVRIVKARKSNALAIVVQRQVSPPKYDRVLIRERQG